ncbi:YdcF family protein [Bartonella sp. TP]|uniref:YdcF family protein n=1 Tax=Bartonella sp. TP TaxID=3057550 RepID=UPI0025AF2C1E|nr:YdcF family protein [Bartonella sp. TP]WJW79531.1 YdcF family protein [Bartonella sp. TP]
MKLRYHLYSLCLILLVGFIAFAILVETNREQRNIRKADAIIVLTGGHARLKTALQLLKQQKGARLLISGANKNLDDAAVIHALGINNKELAQKIDIGRQASNTAENATEAAEWVKKNNYNSVYIVTNDYHMPRSMLELKLTLPNTQLIAYPVKDYNSITQRLRHLNFARFFLLNCEYVKYLKTSGKAIINAINHG